MLYRAIVLDGENLVTLYGLKDGEWQYVDLIDPNAHGLSEVGVEQGEYGATIYYIGEYRSEVSKSLPF